MKKIVFIILAYVTVSCGSQLYVPVESSGNISVENLKTGRALYVKNCASCHPLFMPSQFSAQKWLFNLNEMQVRANIKDAEKNLIYQYLIHAPKKS
jgi:mono/diheme cytochrome c family protein